MSETQQPQSTPPPPPPPPAASSAIRLPDEFMHKNRLQEYTQKSSIPRPIYQISNEGIQHVPRFRATVFVNGAVYTSPNTFSQRKAAEQDVARIALSDITQKVNDTDDGCPLIQEDTTFCKLILNEFAVKMNLERPIYNTIQTPGLLPVFTSSLVFKGVTFTGERGRNKKESEQLAARAAILSLLGDSESKTILSETIKSKVKLYAALHKVSSPGYVNSVAPMIIHSANSQPNSVVPMIAHSGNGQPGMNTLTTSISAACVNQITNQPISPQPLQPFHEFKTPKQEQSPERVAPPIEFVLPVQEQSLVGCSSTVAPPIVFVPPVPEQSLVGCSSSNKKRNRKNKKRPNKKPRMDAQLEAGSVPLNQPSLVQ